MAADIKQLLAIRKIAKRRKPKFIRAGYGDRKRINDKWRKPDGRHTKLRHQFAGHPKKVKPGFRTNRLVRGLHQSGLIPVVINSLNHISLLNKAHHGAIIGKNVGNRKRLLIIQELQKHGISILNLKADHASKLQESFKKRKEQKKAIHAERTAKKSKKEQKGQKKEELTAEEKQVHEKQEKDKLLTKAQK